MELRMLAGLAPPEAKNRLASPPPPPPHPTRGFFNGFPPRTLRRHAAASRSPSLPLSLSSPVAKREKATGRRRRKREGV